jgi:hypothetical protein
LVQPLVASPSAIAMPSPCHTVTALPDGRVLFLETIKYLFGQNARAAHNSSSNRVFHFRHYPDLPFFLLFQESLPKRMIDQLGDAAILTVVRFVHRTPAI